MLKLHTLQYSIDNLWIQSIHFPLLEIQWRQYISSHFLQTQYNQIDGDILCVKLLHFAQMFEILGILLLILPHFYYQKEKRNAYQIIFNFSFYLFSFSKHNHKMPLLDKQSGHMDITSLLI